MELFPGPEKIENPIHTNRPQEEAHYETNEAQEALSFDYEILNDPNLRMRYVNLTDELIRKTQAEGKDHLIFLDKSARPVAWMMKELWPVLAEADENGEIPPMPDVSFLNIDREQWEPIVGRSEDAAGMNIDNIPEKEIQNLRSVFGAERENGSVLKNKNVMLVDEVQVSGDTLRLARGVLNRAFGDEANIDGAHWMMPHIKTDPKSGARYNAELPVWYSDTSVLGRGVANRDSTKSRQSPSRVQRVGANWLSSRFREGPDEKGNQLRKEAKMLAREVADRVLPYFPSPSRSKEDFVSRVRSFNGLEPREFAQIRQEAKERGKSIIELCENARIKKRGAAAVYSSGISR